MKSFVVRSQGLQTVVLIVITMLMAGVAYSQSTGPQIRRQPLPTTGQSVVKGRVIYKDNEQPLQGVTVRIFTGEGRALTAWTNSRGEFKAENLPAGKYFITVEGREMPMQSGFGMRIPLPVTAIPRPEDYEEIEPRHDASFRVDGTNVAEVEVKIPRGGSVSGKVLKPNGAGAGDVEITAISRNSVSAGPFMARFSGRTKTDGSYQIENLPAGEYLVAAATEVKGQTFDIRARMRGETQLVTYHPASISLRNAQTVRVDPGRETGSVNITLVPRRFFTVSGTVVRERDGSPMDGVMVSLINKETQMNGPLAPGMFHRQARTDSEGRWSFTNVSEGSYVVTALEMTMPPRIMMGGPPPTRDEMGRQAREVAIAQKQLEVNTDIEGLSLAMTGLGTIIGIVETDTGEAVPNFVIFLDPMRARALPGRPVPVRIKPDGSFNVELQGGEMYLSVGLPPDSKYFIKSITSASGQDLRKTPLKVIEGAETSPVKVVVSSALASLTGRVTTSDSTQSVSGATVLLVPVETERQRFRTAILGARSSADGSYSLKGAPGEYFVFVGRREELPAVMNEDFIKARSAKASRIVLEPNQSKRLDLTIP